MALRQFHPLKIAQDQVREEPVFESWFRCEKCSIRNLSSFVFRSSGDVAH
jgi:hypothetical protein